MTQEITIPFLEVDTLSALRLEAMDGATSYDLKLKALDVLGIDVPDNTAAFFLSDVWAKHVHDINGLEFSKPFHPAIVSAIRENTAVYKFFFFLA